jgi:uncharacterized protein (TIGR02118 family)
MDRRAMLALGAASAAVLPTGSSAWGEDREPSPTAPGSTVVKLIAIYDRPDDPVAFFHHYEAVHAPLVKKTPGLQSFVLNRITGEMGGGALSYALIAEMTYPDRATFDAAMKSPENAAVGQDLMSFAKGKVRVVVADSAEA